MNVFFPLSQGFVVRLRVVNGQHQFKAVVVDPVIAFLHAHFVAVRITEMIEPGFLIEPDGVYDECVSVPLADGVSVPIRIGIFRKCPPVRPDRSAYRMILKELHHLVRQLNELNRSGR